MTKKRIQEIEVLPNLTDGLVFDKDTELVVVANGTTTTVEFQVTGGGDVTVQLGGNQLNLLDDGSDNLVNLTHGIFAVPLVNYVYCIISGSKAILAASTTKPTVAGVGPFANVAKYLVQNPVWVQNNGFLFSQQLINRLGDDDQSHLRHLDNIPRDSAEWISGVTQTMTRVQSGITLDSIFISTTSGIVRQLHDHTWSSVSNGDQMYVINDFSVSYFVINDFRSVFTDTTGASLQVDGQRYNIVVWGTQDEDGTDQTILVNAPTGFYTNDADAVRDINNTAVRSFPPEYNGTGFLIARFVLKFTSADNGTLEFVPINGNDFEDLRAVDSVSLIPPISQQEFSGANIRIFDSTDPEKKIALDASLITTATTRTVSVPDKDGTLAMLSDLGSNFSKVTITNTAAGIQNLREDKNLSAAIGDGASKETSFNNSGAAEILYHKKEILIGSPTAGSEICEVKEYVEKGDGTLDQVTFREGDFLQQIGTPLGVAVTPNGTTWTNGGAQNTSFYYPKNAAFRAMDVWAAQIGGDALDEANIGVCSVGFGRNVKVSGIYGFGFGQSNLNTGPNSFIGGGLCEVSGTYSLTMGAGSTCDGTVSTAWSAGADADFSGCHVFGDNNGGFAPAIGTRYAATAVNQFLIAAGGDATGGGLAIGGHAPNAKLDVLGSVIFKRRAIAASDTTDGNDFYIGVTSTAAARTVTIQTADIKSGGLIVVGDESGGAETNNITIATQGAQTISGKASHVITNNYGFVVLRSDGTNLFILGDKEPDIPVINEQTGTSYTLTATDNGKTIYLSNALAITLTIPQVSTEDLPKGFTCTVVQGLAGQITLTNEGSDTLLSADSLSKTRTAASSVTLQKRTATTAWFASGDMTA